MNDKIYKRYFCFFLEVTKWLCVILFLIIASVSSYIYRDCNLFYRLAIIFSMVLFSGYLALLTNHGKLLIAFSKEAYQEVRKVVWPTFREGLYTTLIVILVSVIMALILWGLDSVLVYMVSLSLRL